MNNEILVTIGMPVYNSEKFLYQAILSVLNQTYSHFELIITDDGSTDRSVAIIESFNDPRIILIKDSENKGISHRLNQQIQLAKGEYFARMDADDIMHPKRIEEQVCFMMEHPQTDIVGTAVGVIDDNSEILGYRKASHKKTQAEALQGAVFVHPSVLGRTSWFKQHLYKEEFIGMEDYELWIRTIEKSSFAYIDDILLFYRDPLKFKLRTYLFRQRQLRKFFRTEGKKYNTSYILDKHILISYFKSFIAKLLYFLNKDELIIRRRNIHIEDFKIKEELKNILTYY
jgi:glycosyltransferase, group 2 family